MSAINTRTKKDWEDSQKEQALKMMKILVRLIEQDKLKVVSHDFWSHGDDGLSAFTVDLKDNS